MSLLVTPDFTLYYFVEFSNLNDAVLVLVACARTAAFFRTRHAHEVCQVAMRWASQAEL